MFENVSPEVKIIIQKDTYEFLKQKLSLTFPKLNIRFPEDEQIIKLEIEVQEQNYTVNHSGYTGALVGDPDIDVFSDWEIVLPFSKHVTFNSAGTQSWINIL